MAKKIQAIEAETFGMCYGNWGSQECKLCALENECHDYSFGIILNSENPLDALVSALAMKYQHFEADINGSVNHLFIKDRSETPSVKIAIKKDHLQIESEHWKKNPRNILFPKDAIEAIKLAKRICVEL